MTLKIGIVSERKPVKRTVLLAPEVNDALEDYAVIHARQHSQEISAANLAALMIEQFLNSDVAFKRARKILRQNRSEKE